VPQQAGSGDVLFDPLPREPSGISSHNNSHIRQLFRQWTTSSIDLCVALRPYAFANRIGTGNDAKIN